MKKKKPKFTLKATSVEDFKKKFEALKHVEKYYSK